MALGGIELSKIADHCKQLPAYRDALPIISMNSLGTVLSESSSGFMKALLSQKNSLRTVPNEFYLIFLNIP